MKNESLKLNEVDRIINNIKQFHIKICFFYSKK